MTIERGTIAAHSEACMAQRTIEVVINGTRYRMTRDGMECHVNGEWQTPDDDYEMTPEERAAFDALESLSIRLGY